MVSQEELRRARLGYMRETGALEFLRARLEAVRAGVPEKLVAEVTAGYYAKEITPREAARRLRELARRYRASDENDGNGERASLG